MANLDDTVTISLNVLLDALTTPTVLVDAQYRIKAANAAYCTAYGFSAAEMIGKTCHAVSHGLAQPCHESGQACPHHEVMTDGKSCVAQHLQRGADGLAEIHIQAHRVYDADGVALMMETVEQTTMPCIGADSVVSASACDTSPPTLHRIEKQAITQLLRQGCSRREVADRLGISERTLYRKLHKYGFAEDAFVQM